jgi:galactokinase
MTGGGFGGAAIALIETEKIAGLESAVQAEFESRGFLKPELFSVIADDGARRES